MLRGKPAVPAYRARALALTPDLHFTLHATFVGADSVAIHGQGAVGPAKVLIFQEAGRVARAAAHYP